MSFWSPQPINMASWKTDACWGLVYCVGKQKKGAKGDLVNMVESVANIYYI